MIIKKIILAIFILLFFNGCITNTAFLGPALTVANNGNIYQAGLSYGSSKAIKEITKKTSFENLEKLLKPKKNDNSPYYSNKNKNRKIK